MPNVFASDGRRSRRAPPSGTALLVLSVALGACDAAAPASSAPPGAVTVAGPPVTASQPGTPPGPRQPPPPSVLLTLSKTAYAAAIAADADAAYLLTGDAAHRLLPGRPPEAHRVELGFGATATEQGIVFWAEGSVRELSKRDGKVRPRVRLARRPQAFVASESELGWVERSAEGRFSLSAAAGERASLAYVSPGKIDAVAMLSDWLFFVERPAQEGWRIGGVPTSGGTPKFTSLRAGRPPSMLVARDELYYYDGNRRAVLRLSPDLRTEQTLASDFVCSPLAVAQHVYCANVEGLFELVPNAPPRALVKVPSGRFVTDLAANATHLYWIGDAGPDKLAVSALALRE